MGGSDENYPRVIRKSNNHETLRNGSEKIPVAATGQSRRALAAITNTLGTTPHPYAVHKRGLLKEQNAVNNKKPNIPAHRPITRKFAAEMASKQQQQPFIKGTKPSIQQQDSKTKDDKVSSDYNVPTSIKQTEVTLEDIFPMDEEIEMEDVDKEEPVLDIDVADKKNPLAVVEYVDDIYNHYKKTESCSCVPPNYMEQQCDVNERMRGILVDWLIEVHYKFELMEETLFLTVGLMDRFLSVQQVVRKKLQLVGVTAMLIACKYEEVSVPVVEDFILISDRAYCRQEVLDMEKLMANTLEFNFSFPTPYVFMRRFLKVAQPNKQLEMLSFYMIELSLVEYEMLRFPPSLLAAATIFSAQCTISKSKQWSKTSEKHTKYNEDQLLECAKLMVTYHQKAGTGRLNGVYKKYSTWKYGYAAKSEPADFLLHG